MKRLLSADELSHYPAGAAYDPKAPYNEREPKPVKVKLDVYLTIHKVVEAETDKYYKFNGEINDGEYLPPKIEFDEREIENDFLEQTTLPHQLAQLVEQDEVTKWNLNDASGWELDDSEINIITK
jgi:hypothetical protein